MGYPPHMELPSLDAAIHGAASYLRECGALEPSALFLLGTGAGVLPDRLDQRHDFELAEIPGCPAAFDEARLFTGRLQGLPIWAIDRFGDLGQEGPPWSGGFPIWLAAVAGASTLLCTAAAGALPSKGHGAPTPVGSFVVAKDHLNLSGGTPLLGLGDSRLGPMFPDVSVLHDEELVDTALECAERLGLEARPGLVACTPGPALETPAERHFMAIAGAEVAVQGLASPLLAAAHAGLSALVLMVVTDDGSRPVDLASILAASEEAAPRLDDWIHQLTASIQERARAELERDRDA